MTDAGPRVRLWRPICAGHVDAPGGACIFQRENPADVYEELLRVEETRDFPEVLGVDIH